MSVGPRIQTIIFHNRSQHMADKTGTIDEHTLGSYHPDQDCILPTEPALATSNTSDEFHDVRHLYDQAPTGITISLIASTLLAWWLMESVPDYIVLPWLAFIALTSIMHLFVVKQFRLSGAYISISSNWVSYNAFLFSMLGLAWSVGYLFFFPYISETEQMFLFYAAGLMAIGMLPVLSAVLSGYMIFISAVAIPLLFLLIGQPAERMFFMALGIMSSYVLLAVVAKNYQVSLGKSHNLASNASRQARQQFENSEQIKETNLKLRKEAEDYRKASIRGNLERDQALKTLQSINEGVITTDHAGKINFINPVAEVYLGWEKEHVIGKRIERIFNIVDQKTRKKLVMPVDKCLDSKSIITGNNSSILVRRDGVEYAIEYTLTPVTDKQSSATGTALVFRDVTEKRELEKNLTWQASHDPLTGLINRREFDNRLSKIISSDNIDGNEHALCFIDLDNFKIINDSCGHVAGDELLKKIAACLKNKSRDTDTIARIGGDEFGVILYSCAMGKAGLIAEIFREQIEKLEFHWQGRTYNITSSIGVIAIDNSYRELSDVIRAADISCYDAKDKGKNQVSLLVQGDRVINDKHSQIQWVEKIRDCLARQAFALHTQEIRPLDDMNEILICENLLRIDDAGELVLPGQYMPAIERYHMMPEIDRWVVKASFELLAYGHPVLDQYNVVSINLSEQSIADEKLIAYILNLVEEYEIRPERICFDVPESSLHRNVARTERFIQSIKAGGCRIAIDNFSSGLDTFRILKPLDIDFIKFNGRISDMSNEKKGLEYTILESINQISHLIGAQTIGKYISDENNLDVLFDIGVDYAQGFYISRPAALS